MEVSDGRCVKFVINAAFSPVKQMKRLTSKVGIFEWIVTLTPQLSSTIYMNGEMYTHHILSQ